MNNFATSSGDLGAGLSRSASALHTAGVDMYQTLAMLTGGAEITQNADEFGNFLKIASMRIRGMKGELEELGEEVDDSVNSISKVQTQILNITHGKINIFDDSGEFRNYYEIMQDIAEIFDDLSSTERANLTEILFGKQRGNQGAALLQAFQSGQIQKAYQTAVNSMGSAYQEQERWLQSLEAKTQQFKAAWQSLSETFLNSDSLKNTIDIGTKFINILDKIVSKIGSLNTILLGLGIGKEIKKFISVRKEFESLGKSTAFSNIFSNVFPNLSDSVKSFSSNLKQGKGVIDSFKGSASSLWKTMSLGSKLFIGAEVIGLVVSGIQAYNQKQSELRQKNIEAANSAITEYNNISQLYDKYNEINNLYKSGSSSKEEYTEATTTLLTALGVEESQIPALVAKYGSLEEALKRIVQLTQEANLDELGIGVQSAKDDFIKQSNGFFDSKDFITQENNFWGDKSETKIANKLEKAGYLTSKSSALNLTNRRFSFYSDASNPYQKAVEEYQKMLEMKQALEDGIGVDYTREELNNSQLYKTISNRINDLKFSYEEAVKLINQANQLVTKQKFDDLLVRNKGQMPQTIAEFNTFKDILTDTILKSGEFYGSQEEAQQFVANYLHTIPQLTQFYSALGEVSTNTVEKVRSSLADSNESTTKLVSNIAAVQKVLQSQSTGTALTLADFKSEELKDYTSALEYHNGVIQLNAEKVSEIIELKSKEQIEINNTNKALAQSEYLKNAGEIEKLRQKIKEKNFAEGESRKVIQDNIDALLQQNDAIQKSCIEYDLITSSLEEATNAYSNWINSQTASQSGDMFDETLNAINRINDTLNNAKSEFYGRVGRTDYQAAVGLIVPESVDPKDQAKVKEYLKSIYNMFYYDNEGNRTGLNLEYFCKEAVEKGLMVFDKASNEYNIAGQKTMEDFANGLNLSMPMVQAMFGELEEFGAEFSWADEAVKTIGDLGVAANVAAENLRAIDPNLSIAIDVSDFETEAEKVNSLQNTITQMQQYKTKVGIDPSEVEYVNSIITYCVAQMQELENPAILQIDVSKATEASQIAGEAIGLLQEFKTNYNNLVLTKELGLDTTTAEAKVQELLTKITSSKNDYLISLGLDTTSVANLNASLSAIELPTIQAKFNLDDTVLKNYTPDTKKSTMEYDVDTTKVDAFKQRNDDKKSTLFVEVDTSKVLSFQNNLPKFSSTISLKPVVTSLPSTIQNTNSGKSKVSGSAFAGGNWGTKIGGRTLVGELGRKILRQYIAICIKKFI